MCHLCVIKMVSCRRTSRGLASATANVNQGVEDMRQRMSKMFQPKNLGNQPGLPSLFRKK